MSPDHYLSSGNSACFSPLQRRHDGWGGLGAGLDQSESKPGPKALPRGTKMLNGIKIRDDRGAIAASE